MDLQDDGMKISVGLFLVFVPMVVGRVVPPSLKALVESSVMKPASIGVFVVPLEGEEPVIVWRADKALIPASTMKVITTATALQVLGPEFAFETKIYL
ncbi:MAG: D-alanyl-D-alanine carboxypeptidase/D-alanyl-D-alanine-endopeptidase (penicillin-binding protein 4), partial [Akkermansiaceae bacterium]